MSGIGSGVNGRSQPVFQTVDFFSFFVVFFSVLLSVHDAEVQAQPQTLRLPSSNARH